MSEDRECTCHPDEAPVPCRKKYAFTECENEQLREENARYKLTYAKYVEATDRMNGTPCEQIRHQQEVEALREENARLREALKPFAAAAEDLDEDDKDNLPIWEHWAAGSVEIGHLRAAAAAIREGEKGDGKNS